MGMTVVDMEEKDTGIILTLEDSLGRRYHVFATRSGVVCNPPNRGITWTPFLSALGIIEHDDEWFHADEFYVEQDDEGAWGVVVFNELNQILWLTAEGVEGGDGVVPWGAIVHTLESIPEA